MANDGEIPFDPDSPIFSYELDPTVGDMYEFDSDSIASALRLPFEASDPVVGDLIVDERFNYTRLLETYGMDKSLVDKLGELFGQQDQVHLSGSNEVTNGVTTVVGSDGVGITAYISPRAVRNFVTDAMHAIKPVGGDDEIRFARDSGFKMAFTFGLTVALFDHMNERWVGESNQNKSVDNLLHIGHEDIPMLPADDYEDFIPFRLAARLAIDRLRQLSVDFFDTKEGEQIELDYLDARARSLRGISLGTYGDISIVDLATANPLDPNQTKQFFSQLKEVSKNPNLTIAT